MTLTPGQESLAPIANAVVSPQNPRLSPDGLKLALRVGSDLWVYDLQGKPPINLTFGESPRSMVWTPDGRRLIFEPNEVPVGASAVTERATGGKALVAIAADGSGAREPASPEQHFHPFGWSAEGDLLAVHYPPGTNQTDIVRLQQGSKGSPGAVVQAPFDEGRDGASVSPDGRWIAYAARTTGTSEIWVRPLSGSVASVRVSPNGGTEPIWSRDGRELFYLEGLRIMSIAVDLRSGFNFKPPTLVFESRLLRSEQAPSYDVASDGTFILARSAEVAPNPITVVLNWSSQ